MRILITNPDTLGDLILRQPLFTALLDHGHEVCLVMRKSYSLITPYIDTRLRVFTFDIHPYHPDVVQRKDDFRSLLLDVRNYAPDCVVIAPYQRTLLDEWIVEALPASRSVALSGYLYNDVLRCFPDTNLRVTSVVYCPEEMHEVEKNRRLAAEILCQDVQLGEPKLACTDAILHMAEDYVDRLGLTPGKYLVGNIAGFANTAIKLYGTREWQQLFGHMFSEYNSQILLTGIDTEEDYIENFMQSLGTYRYQMAKWIGNPSNLDLLIGLIGSSCGYVGHDTGTMHAAAALGKPVFALFGGGNWPRFLPRCTTGIVTTLALPCFGCNWNCHFEDAPCIKAIPINEVLKSLDVFLTNAVGGLTINKLRPDDVSMARLWHEGRKRYFDKVFALQEASRSLLEKDQALGEKDRIIEERDQALQNLTRASNEQQRMIQTLEETVAILSTGRQAVRTAVKAALLKMRLGFIVDAFGKEDERFRRWRL